MTPTGPTFRDLVRPGLRAVRQNWRPFVALQLLALGVVVAYYHVDAVRGGLDALAAVRQRWGVVFTMLVAAFAGAVLPELAKALTQRGWRLDRERINELTFLALFFPGNGLITDAFYKLMEHTFGSGTDWTTILKKAVVDQYGYTPFVALPIVALAFAWRRNGFSLGRLGREIRIVGPWGWYVRRVVTLMLPGWCFWGPMVLLIYSLPEALQVPLWAAALGAWSLVMVFIGRDDGEVRPEPVPPPE